VYVYDPATNTWSAGTSLPMLLSDTCTVALGSNLYTLGGSNGMQQSVVYRTSVSSSYTWTGTTSTNWNTATNWSGGVVPTAADDVLIPAGLTRCPVVSTSTATARNITNSGGQLTVGDGSTLTLTGDFVNNGPFTAVDNATVALTGIAAQAIGGTAPITQFRNLTVGAAGATLAGEAEIQRLLTLTGNLTTNGQRFLILSNRAGSGMVHNNGGVVIGSAVVQRYIDVAGNAGVGYRHFAPAVSGAALNNLAIYPDLPGAQAAAPIQVNTTYNSAAQPGLVSVSFPHRVCLRPGPVGHRGRPHRF
jgi:hypothetical protein